ncbi:unnamed protein product [Linum tenue]|uniref:Raptor N-terminal CASPase-like domain-containing protein n=1 Tax=Linum tenue TaxID=586396 RepID=A0AAV0KRN7_9ROSI|nr:unnamed protein product [Linum tenue]
MALGDLMASRFSQSSSLAVVSNHYDDGASTQADRRDSEAASSSYGNAGTSTTTSMAYLPQTIVLCELRHEAFEVSVPTGPSDSGIVSKWRPKDRMKTGYVALVLCLNISVDPPDVIKISPCARMECWIDPFSMVPSKALDTIGKTLNLQYERWQPRARYKVQLDPTVEEVKKVCNTCRKYAKSERVLFHYNGHGVPKPTPNGEIWLFKRSLLPQSTIYNWSSGHFSKPLLTATDDSEEILIRREEREKFALEHISKCQHSSVGKLNNQIAGWDTKFEAGTKAALLQPFSPIVVAADDNERIRVWNYEEAALLNGFDNHDFPDKGISKLCLVNELDDSLLLVGSCDGNIRIWKDYSIRGKQKLVTAFPSIQGHKPGSRSLNAVVDWQQQSGYLYASGEVSSVMVWDLEKEQLINSIPTSSDCSVSSLSASQVHGGQFAVGFVDGSVRLYDVRTPETPVCTMRPHTQKVERVVGIGFQPGLDPAKIVSASQAGDIQFLDIRTQRDAYLTINAHRGSLTALAVHKHAPIIASGSAKQIIKVFSLEGVQLGTIRYYSTFMAQKIGSVGCLTFHPYQLLLASGAADAYVSLWADDNTQAR